MCSALQFCSIRPVPGDHPLFMFSSSTALVLAIMPCGAPPRNSPNRPRCCHASSGQHRYSPSSTPREHHHRKRKHPRLVRVHTREPSAPSFFIIRYSTLARPLIAATFLVLSRVACCAPTAILTLPDFSLFLPSTSARDPFPPRAPNFKRGGATRVSPNRSQHRSRSLPRLHALVLPRTGAYFHACTTSLLPIAFQQRISLSPSASSAPSSSQPTLLPASRRRGHPNRVHFSALPCVCDISCPPPLAAQTWPGWKCLHAHEANRHVTRYQGVKQ